MGEARLEHPTPARRGIRVTVGPLPFRPPRVRDELLSSWVGRLAKANQCPVEELCSYLGLEQGRVPERAGGLRMVNWGRLCGAVQWTSDEIVAMTLPDAMHHCARYVSLDDFQYCPGCVEKTPDLVLRRWRFAWPMTCETCGQVLAAKYPAKVVSGRLRARAIRGAEALKTTVVTNNLARIRRVNLTMQVMSVLKIGHLWSLTSGNEHEMLLALAAINVGTTRPLVGAAIILRGNDRATQELRRVFPQHRRVIERIRGLSQDLDRRRPERRETGRPPEQEELRTSKSRASERALKRARQAISELGPDANRQALLTRTGAIWKRSSSIEH